MSITKYNCKENRQILIYYDVAHKVGLYSHTKKAQLFHPEKCSGFCGIPIEDMGNPNNDFDVPSKGGILERGFPIEMMDR